MNVSPLVLYGSKVLLLGFAIAVYALSGHLQPEMASTLQTGVLAFASVHVSKIVADKLPDTAQAIMTTVTNVVAMLRSLGAPPPANASPVHLAVPAPTLDSKMLEGSIRKVLAELAAGIPAAPTPPDQTSPSAKGP